MLMYAAILASVALGAWRLLGRRSHGSIAGKRILITGCDSGFGELMALHYCREGAHIYAGVLTPTSGSSLESKTTGKGTISSFLLDVTNKEHFKQGFGHVQSQLNGTPLDALICNAGIFKGWLTEFTPEEEYKEVMDVNFMGCLRTIRAFLPLVKRPDGRVIGITSVASFWSSRAMSAYACSKFAQGALLDALRMELLPCGIRVIQICPGFYNTPILYTHWKEKPLSERVKDVPDEVKQRYGSIEDESIISMKGAFKMAKDPIAVVKEVRKAVLHRWPSSRMLVGWDAVVFWFVKAIPSFIIDPLFLAFATKEAWKKRETDGDSKQS